MKELPMRPDVVEAAYGPYERNKFDIYLARSDKPTPLLFFVHGGGFMGGDKQAVEKTSLPLAECLAAGISISTIQYRLTDAAPFPAQMHDSAAALQYIRCHASEWNIDPTRVAACGPSAGAGISQWLAFHKDLAVPGSSDPVKRQSSRVRC
ncbi:MAG TPA: alpha/beta hydrolase, partial [Planctomycetes bacterium]|nr:alpha/beta hydrolase [Planctomycetota bacterium]